MSDVDMESINGDDLDVTVDDKGLTSSEEGELSDSEGEEERKGESNIPTKDLVGNKGTTAKVCQESEVEELYRSLGLEEGSDTRRHTRTDTIHLRGTHHMDTNDVFEYFYPHKPLFIEWVDEAACNVVWPDDVSAATALIFHSDSKPRASPPPGLWRAGVPHQRAPHLFLRLATRSDKEVINKEKLKVLPSKYRAAGLLSQSMKDKIKSIQTDEYATEESANNPWGQLCQTWGINDSQEVFGLSAPTQFAFTDMELVDPSYKGVSVKQRIGLGRPAKQEKGREGKRVPLARAGGGLNLKMRLGKRVIPAITEARTVDSHEESSEEEWTSRSKVPRMRMHADDEQDRQKRNRVKERLEGGAEGVAITVEIHNHMAASRHRHRDRNRPGFSKGDLRARLRRRRRGDESESSESDHNSESGTGTVWARLDSSLKQETDSDGDIEGKVPSSRPGFEKSDLRVRLNRKKVPGSPLRIEVDNDHYSPHSD